MNKLPRSLTTIRLSPKGRPQDVVRIAHRVMCVSIISELERCGFVAPAHAARSGRMAGRIADRALNGFSQANVALVGREQLERALTP
jgi:hypothetical protein